MERGGLHMTNCMQLLFGNGNWENNIKLSKKTEENYIKKRGKRALKFIFFSYTQKNSRGVSYTLPSGARRLLIRISKGRECFSHTISPYFVTNHKSNFN